MSERTITIIIDAKEGTAETETKGFRGGACKANSTVKAFRSALGEITDEKDTPEMRLPAVGVATQQHVQN